MIEYSCMIWALQRLTFSSVENEPTKPNDSPSAVPTVNTQYRSLVHILSSTLNYYYSLRVRIRLSVLMMFMVLNIRLDRRYITEIAWFWNSFAKWNRFLTVTNILKNIRLWVLWSQQKTDIHIKNTEFSIIAMENFNLKLLSSY